MCYYFFFKYTTLISIYVIASFICVITFNLSFFLHFDDYFISLMFFSLKIKTSYRSAVMVLLIYDVDILIILQFDIISYWKKKSCHI